MPAFAATLNATVPLPLPEPPLVIVIHDALADADHEHQLPVATVNEPLPAVLSNDPLVGEIE